MDDKKTHNMTERTLEDVLNEDPGPLLDPMGGPPDEALLGIYQDPEDGDDDMEG